MHDGKLKSLCPVNCHQPHGIKPLRRGRKLPQITLIPQPH